MQKARSHPRPRPKAPPRLPPLVGTRFQVLFHSPPGVLFTFPSRYSCTIGRGRVFSLGGWSPQFQSGLLGAPDLLRYPCHPTGSCFAYRALTCSGGPFQTASTRISRPGGIAPRTGPTTPESYAPRFGLFPVRSPLLRESRLISLPPGTEMFQFPGLALPSGSDGSLHPPGCPIRTSADHRKRAPPHGFSQLATSFIACPRLGIPRVPLLRLASSSTTASTPTTPPKHQRPA
jgi:hypothetical protein